MKIIIDIQLPETNLKTICVTDSSFFVEEDGDKVILKTKEEDRFNTMIGLFGCRNSWEKNSLENPTYRVTFIDNFEEVYDFDNSPDNWNMFMGYLEKLLGDSYGL